MAALEMTSAHPLPNEHRSALRWLLLYVGLFAVLMTLASKKFDRYMLPAQMLLDPLAGVVRMTPKGVEKRNYIILGPPPQVGRPIGLITTK